MRPSGRTYRQVPVAILWNTMHPVHFSMQAIWAKLSGLKWMHSSSAGLEHLLFPDLVNGPIVLTNAKGVYSNSLAEFALVGGIRSAGVEV